MGGLGDFFAVAAPIAGAVFGGPAGYAAGAAIGSAISGSSASGESRAAAAKTAALADPFASQRAQYQQQLASAVKSPEQFAANYQTAPGYQFRLAEQNKAINRAFAAKGMSTSGNLFLELLQRSGDLASQEFASDWARQMSYTDLLSTLSGAQTGAPGAAAQTYLSAQETAQQQQQSAGASLTSAIGLAYPQLFGNSSSIYTPSTVGNIWS